MQTRLTNDHLSDQLYIDYSNIWACCVLLEEGLELREDI